MGRRKEHRLAAQSAVGRRLKLDIFVEPSEIAFSGRLIFGPDVASVFLSSLLIAGHATFCFQVFNKIGQIDHIFRLSILVLGVIITALIFRGINVRVLYALMLLCFGVVFYVGASTSPIIVFVFSICIASFLLSIYLAKWVLAKDEGLP